MAAIAFQNEYGNTEIQLFVENYPLETKRISEYLKTRLPAYMIPAGIVSLDIFPVNASNKIDRIALKKRINR